MLAAAKTGEYDLFIETNGGVTDATENIVSLLLQAGSNFRAIVPNRAKSNGTLIALASAEIVMGNQSELGPIDPSIAGIPCTFLINSGADPITLQVAQRAIDQTTKLATNVLKRGMLKDKSDEQVSEVVASLASRDVYHSHGSVIDHGEAAALGLNVRHLEPTDELWKKLWLLRCMYEHDARVGQYAKIFESEWISHSIRVQT